MIHLPEPHAQMPHPGAFKGSRLKFLQDELTEYAKAVINDHAEDFALDVIRRFFKRYPLDLQDTLVATIYIMYYMVATTGHLHQLPQMK